MHLFVPSRPDPARADYFIGFHWLDTSSGVELPEADRNRLLCHLLLTQLPDTGILEAVEDLMGLVQFYREPRAPAPVLPPPRTFRATISEVRVRPVYPVMEEE